MRGDRTPFSPTELAQLSRCEQQLLYDRRYGAKRSAHWRQRSVEGNQVHARMHREVQAPQGKGRPMLTALLIGAVIALLLFLAFARAGGPSTDELLPEELQGAKLWQTEKSLSRQKPVHIRGRPDEVWVKDGKRYIVETKSRAGRVFEGDRMQLAAYGYLLRATDGPPLAPHGYIRFTGGEQSFAKVKLKGDDAVIEAHRRLQALTKKKAEPGFASAKAMCQGCGHEERCPGSRIS
ncbi:Dna2/Cas4 domain-containing protein [Parvularcula sp. ZS-1/3]|uniref:Dna2/Cas4 domain-containing protein n=1 Tax=Parvularcula mediterranea TaxID=2732508 RepID=A0A7Y3W5E5_9PROT|nr:PD-(D/E)XK nuclease family protein [Parvularcula mediterranea]NNU16700.1 Dna2/Cas4 domain-containing protein [Parvularcula mediterranea]